MLLIEVGGLGFMSFTTLIAILLGKKITLRERLILQDAMNTFNIQGLVRMVKYVLMFTVSVQFFGALLFSTQFIPQYGLSKGMFIVYSTQYLHFVMLDLIFLATIAV